LRADLEDTSDERLGIVKGPLPQKVTEQQKPVPVIVIRTPEAAQSMSAMGLK
jgi:hypothetical protein